MTRDLARRVWQHKTMAFAGFSAQYGMDGLVWYELYERIDETIAREKQLKRWRRARKVALIDAMNPTWTDLYDHLAT